MPFFPSPFFGKLQNGGRGLDLAIPYFAQVLQDPLYMLCFPVPSV
jgi:hypothetical protein